MKPKELLRILFNRLNKAEYFLNEANREVEGLKAKIKGFNQLLETNQSLLLWALYHLADEQDDKVVKVPLDDIDKLCKRIRAKTEKDEESNALIVRFEEK